MKNPKTDWHEDVQLPANSKKHRSAVLNMLKKSQSMSYGHHGPINVAKYWIELLNDEVGSVHSASYRKRPVSRQLATTKINRMLAEKVLESAFNE